MDKEEDSLSREARHGQKMVEVKIRFWTNDISPEAGKIRPRHAWSSGVIRMESNPSHGIVPGNPKPFHSLMDIGAVVEEVLIEHGITLHISRRMEKFVTRE